MQGAISERWLIIGAFFVTYFVWGSTYLVNYLAIESIPPFLMSGARFFTAGALLFLWASWRRHPMPAPAEWRNAAGMGILFLSLGTGGVVWAQQYIDTGLAALLVAFDPLLIMLLMWALLGRRPALLSLTGAGIGIVGMSMLVGQPQLVKNSDSIAGLMAIALSMFSWAIASIYVSRLPMPVSRLRTSAVQMLGGGTALLLFSLISGESAGFRLGQVSQQSALSWAFLVLMGSLLAFSCFNYLLTKVSPEKVATNTYVNPVVAMTLGWAFNNEQVTAQSILAGTIMITGVFFINVKR
jgi:drug/metabolite transporter (DMT)-like permease